MSEKRSCTYFTDERNGLFIEDASHGMERKHLPDDVYAQAIEGFVIVCTDAVIVDRENRMIWLARRRIKPAQDQWWVIGGRTYAGETREESVRRCFKRETKLDLPSMRFTYLRTNEYLWKDRQQAPQNVGSHNEARIFTVELDVAERWEVHRNLDPDEYHAEEGLRGFNLDNLIAADAHPMLPLLYDQIFRDR